MWADFKALPRFPTLISVSCGDEWQILSSRSDSEGIQTKRRITNLRVVRGFKGNLASFLCLGPGQAMAVANGGNQFGGFLVCRKVSKNMRQSDVVCVVVARTSLGAAPHRRNWRGIDLVSSHAASGHFLSDPLIP